MAFRKFRRFRSFNRGSRGRRRGGLNWQKAGPTRRWEFGNVSTFTNMAVANVGDSCTNSALLLARVENAAEEGGGGVPTAQGVALTEMIRRLEIGGVVLTMWWQSDDVIDFSINQDTAQLVIQHALVIDRLDSTGAPAAAAGTQWNRTTFPTRQTLTAAQGPEDTEFPMRVLWRDIRPLNLVPLLIDNVVEGLIATQYSAVGPNRISINKRLRVPIDDDHGLFLVRSIWTPADYTSQNGGARGFRLGLHGSVYYRTRF